MKSDFAKRFHVEIPPEDCLVIGFPIVDG
jgi:hypothetical protein